MLADDLLTKGHENEYMFKKWLIRIFKRWHWFVISLIACLVLAFLYLSLTTPTYQAVASLMVKDETKGGELVDDRKLQELGLTSSSKLVVNEIEILKSYDLMQIVVDSLQLYTAVHRAGLLRDEPIFGNEIPFILQVDNPEAISIVRHWTITDSSKVLRCKIQSEADPFPVQFGYQYAVAGIRFRIFNNPDYINTVAGKGLIQEYKIDVIPRNEVVIQYSRALLVDPANKLSSVINLEIRDNNQIRATSVLRSLVSIYNRRGLDKRNLETSNTINFITDRLATVARDLKDVENSVEKFKSENKLTKLSTDAEQYLASARQVDAQKTESETRLNIVVALERDLLANSQTIPSAFGIQDASLESLVEKYNDLLQQRTKIRDKSGPQNPLLIELETRIKELRAQLLTTVRNLKQAYSISLNDITKKDDQLKSMIQNVPQLEKRLVQITRSQNVQEQLYTYLLQKREEATVSQASNVQDSQTIVEARNLGMVSPKRKIIWAIGILAGLLIPLAFIRVYEFFYSKVGDINQVEEHTSVPLLGIVSHIKQVKSSFVINSHSRSAVAEQLRHLRTSIGYSLRGKAVKTILVTSFQPGDGKSFVSLNLAACYALLKKKTVMLEFDLRKPHIARDLDLQQEEGLSTVLAGTSKLEEQLVKVEDYDGFLYVLPAGNQPSNPTELILGDKMPSLIKKLSEMFDYIIINSPPVGVVTDANLLQKYADITLMILRQDHTSSVVYKELKSRIAQHPDAPVFVVLNDVGKRSIHRGSYSYGSYGYALGKDYYSKK